MLMDKDKVRIIQDGIAEDPELVGMAFEVFGSKIRHFAANKVGPIVADDIVSQTFLRLLQYHKKFDKTKSKFTTWLHHIAYMECLQWIKQDSKYDRCEDVKLHLSGNETMSVYRRYAGIDSNIHFQVKEMVRKKYDVQLDKLDKAKHVLRKCPNKYPALNIILKHRGDVIMKDIAKELGTTISKVDNMIKKERNLLLNIKKVRKKWTRRIKNSAA
jgi:DNA-directed RNA polymerase specialized sigma24 family protein